MTVLIVALLSATTARAANEFANINQGNLRVGGSLSYLTDKSAAETTRFLSVSPLLEYFVVDRLGLGAQVSYSSQSSQNGSFSTSDSTTFGPLVTFFFWESGKAAAFAEQQYIRYTSSRDTTPYWTSHTRLGVDYFIIPQIALGPVFAFNKDSGAQSDVYWLTLNVGFSLFF